MVQLGSGASLALKPDSLEVTAAPAAAPGASGGGGGGGGAAAAAAAAATGLSPTEIGKNVLAYLTTLRPAAEGLLATIRGDMPLQRTVAEFGPKPLLMAVGIVCGTLALVLTLAAAAGMLVAVIAAAAATGVLLFTRQGTALVTAGAVHA